jgi:hypothetical protein
MTQRRTHQTSKLESLFSNPSFFSFWFYHVTFQAFCLFICKLNASYSSVLVIFVWQITPKHQCLTAVRIIPQEASGGHVGSPADMARPARC